MLPADLRERFQILALGLPRLICRPRMNRYPLNISPRIHPRLNHYQCQVVPIRPSQPLKYRSPMRPLPIWTHHHTEYIEMQ